MEKGLRWLSLILLFFNAMGAFYGAWQLINDPTGQSMGINVSFLHFSPFQNFLIPGIILLVCNGLLPLWVAWQGITHISRFPKWLLAQAIISGGWIVIQVILLRQIIALHVIFFSIALVWLVCSILLQRLNQKMEPGS